MDALPQTRLLGHAIHSVTAQQALDHIMTSLAEGRGGWVLTPNLDILRRLATDRAFADLTRDVTLRLADGMPLVWASRLRGAPLPERVAGSDLIWSLCARAAQEGYRIYLLGGNPGAAERAARVLRARNDGLEVAGCECPPLGFERDETYQLSMRARLRAARPDIVFVALGCPKQERLIRELRDVLPGAWFLGVGISFSFVCGEVRRAPLWMRRTGLEWLHRMAQEPGRLAKRYLVDGLPFAVELLARSAAAGVFARGSDTPTPARAAQAKPVDAAIPPSEAA